MRISFVQKREQTEMYPLERDSHSYIATQALGNLAAVLTPEARDDFFSDNALLAAAGAVGQALNIRITAPTRFATVTRTNPLEAIAHASRLRIRRVQLVDGWWRADCGPLLGYIESDQAPVALLPRAGQSYEVFDPKRGTRTPLHESMAHQLSSTAYIFYRPFPDRAIHLLEVLRFALTGHTQELLTILWTGAAATGLGMFTPYAIALLIDRAIPDADRVLLAQLGAGLLAASFGAGVFQLVHRWVIVRVQTVTDLTTQAALWDRLLSLNVSFFRDYSTGDLTKRALSVSQIRSLLSGATLSTLFTSIFALLNLGFLFIYSVQLAVVALAIVAMAFLVTSMTRRRILQQFRSLQQLEGDLLGLMVQLIGGITKLRVAGAEDRAFAYWAKYYTQQLQFTLKTRFWEDLLLTFNTLLPQISSMILFGLAVSLMAHSQGTGQGLSTGRFLAFHAAFGTFISGATDLSNTIIKLLEVSILWERAQPILTAPPEVDDSKAEPGPLAGYLKLDRVSFRYQAEGLPVLDRVTLEAKPEEFIAVVGPSGSGKSTLLRLLLGFETPDAGSIYYDGQQLASLDLTAVRRQLGVVLQNGRVTSTSIFENICNGALVTLDDVWEAAALAGLADDIRAMPMGMHTIISGGGSNLSGGQRQRLLLARALIGKPKILLLDEATSALDNRTQAQVSRNLEQLQVTRVAIAHRLSTIRQADHIYVLDQGQIVQQGTFDQLTCQPGLFQRLMARQR